MVLYSLNRSLKVKVRVSVNVPVKVNVPVDTLYLVCSRSTELMQSMFFTRLIAALRLALRLRLGLGLRLIISQKLYN